MKFSFWLALLFSMHVVAMRVENKVDLENPEILASLLDALVTDSAHINEQSNICEFQHNASGQRCVCPLSDLASIITSVQAMADGDLQEHERDILQYTLEVFEKNPELLTAEDRVNIQIMRLGERLMNSDTSLLRNVQELQNLINNQINDNSLRSKL